MYIIDSQIFPTIDYFKIISQNKYVKIDECDKFRKMSFSNRYVIAGANGLITLTAPVVGGREQKALMKDIKVDDTTNWRTSHWRSIVSSYNSSPYFDYYRAEVEKMLFFNTSFLYDLNILILGNILKLMDINTIVFLNSLSGIDEVAAIDFRNHILPKNYQHDSFNWRPKYSQVFEERIGFQPNLSILDLLFCEGPNAKNLLM